MVALHSKCTSAITFESLWQCGHAHPRRAHVQGPRGDARGGRYRGHGRRLPARGQGACTRKSGERTYTHTERERERERCAQMHTCTLAHTRSESVPHAPSSNARMHTHTHTHTHTQVGPIADDAIKIGAKVLWLQLAVRNAGLFCLCNRSLLPLYYVTLAPILGLFGLCDRSVLPLYLVPLAHTLGLFCLCNRSVLPL